MSISNLLVENDYKLKLNIDDIETDSLDVNGDINITGSINSIGRLAIQFGTNGTDTVQLFGNHALDFLFRIVSGISPPLYSFSDIKQYADTGNLLIETQTLGTNQDLSNGGRLLINSINGTFLFNTKDSSSISTGSLTTSGGIGISKNVVIGGNYKIDSGSSLFLEDNLWGSLLQDPGGSNSIEMAGLYPVLRFPPGITRWAYFQSDVPHNIRKDGTKEIHIHLYTTSLALTNINFSVRFNISPQGESVNLSSYDYQNDNVIYTNDSVTPRAHHKFTLATFTYTTNPGDIIRFQIGRIGADPNDTFINSVYIIGCGLHYECDNLAGTETY